MFKRQWEFRQTEFTEIKHNREADDFRALSREMGPFSNLVLLPLAHRPPTPIPGPTTPAAMLRCDVSQGVLYLLYVSYPVPDVVEGLLVGDVIYQHDPLKHMRQEVT